MRIQTEGACSLRRMALTALAAVLCVLSARAQTAPGALRVRVLDADWDVPLEGALVQVLESNQRATTGEDGSVLLDAIPGGAYTLVVSASGFERLVRPRVTVLPGEARVEEVRLLGVFTDMEEFVIKDFEFGGFGSEMQQLEIRSSYGGLMDAVGADMMSKAGAGTAAAALRLVTGATVQDGKYAVIRGLGDRYTATLLNSVRMPTADKDKRAVHLDQFPSAMIESVQVTKTFLPDQQGDASGGINIVTKSVPDGTVLSFSVSTEYDTNATGEDEFKSYRGGGNGFGGMRGPGSLRFWDRSGLGAPRGTQSRRQEDPDAPPLTVADEQYSSALRRNAPPMNSGFKFAAGDSVELGDWTVGGLLIGSYSQKYKYRDGLKFGMQSNQDATKVGPLEGWQEYVDTSMDEQLWSMGMTLGAKSEDHEVKVTGLYTHLSRDVVEMRYGPKTGITTTTNDIRSGRVTIGKRINESRSRTFRSVMQYSENANASLQLAGRHRFPWLKDAELDWTGAYNMAESIEPDRRSVTGVYAYRREIRTYNPGRPEQPSDVTQSEMEFDDFERRWQDTREDAWQGQTNLKLPYEVFGNEGYFKTGLFGDFMDRTYRNRAFTIPVPGSFPADDEYDLRPFAALDDIPLPENLNPKSIEYDGKQDLTATYLMLKAPLPEWVELVGGARFESTLMKTDVRSPVSDVITLYYLITEENALSDEERNSAGRIGYRSNVDPTEANALIDQVDTLPAVALNLKPVEDVSLRLAYGRTIARPTFKEITPVLYEDFDASRVFLGNPSLQMSELDNYDTRLEWRPGGGVDILAASLFYKTIRDPIQYSTRRDTQAGAIDYIYPENYGEATIRGLELEARKGLGFIWERIADFSVGGNLTLQESDVRYPDDIREKLQNANVFERSRPMDGQSEILGNLNLVYDNDAVGLSVGLFYNLKGETYVSGDTATDDTYIPAIVERPVGTLDLVMRLKFAKIWRVGFECKNLLNPDIETIYRTPYRDIPNTTYKIGRIYGMSLGCEW